MDLENRLWLIPETPSRDPNGHDDIDNHLGKEDEEEGEEVEGTVTPTKEQTHMNSPQGTLTEATVQFLYPLSTDHKCCPRLIISTTVCGSQRWYTPEGFVHRSVPADEGAGGE